MISALEGDLLIEQKNLQIFVKILNTNFSKQCTICPFSHASKMFVNLLMHFSKKQYLDTIGSFSYASSHIQKKGENFLGPRAMPYTKRFIYVSLAI